MIPLVAALFGAVIGSFLNVVIHRVPRKLSIVSPPSTCPKCAARIAPWDNVPVVSWVLLGGKCRRCRAGISPRYPFVEAATALLFAGTALVIPDPATLLPALAFVAAMVVVTFIDFDHKIIPDAITLPGTVLALVLAFTGHTVSPAQAFLGALAGGGSLFAVAWGYRLATGRDGLGGGDVKLLMMVGAFLGPGGAFLTILLGSIAGTFFALATMRNSGRGMRSELPFGTFLAPGAIVVMLVGSRLVAWYWNLFL
jgi:leader peptidase (prepilin peptidase)/N-methyltransferase